MITTAPEIKQVSFPLILDGVDVGVIHRFGYEIHFEIHPKYQNIFATKFRTAVQAYINDLLKEPIVTTRVRRDQPVSLRLVPRLGFVETHRSESHVFYTLEKAPFKRNHHGR